MTGKGRFNRLFESGNIGKVKTKNRIVRVAAGTDYVAPGGFLNPEKTKYCNHCGVVMQRPEIEQDKREQAPERPSHKVGSPDTKKAEEETEEDTKEAKTEPKEEQTTDAIFCIHCGAENPPVAKFCKKCGKPMN